jgi:3-oxoacyl-[acyl-carrier-protein] synthase-3
LEVRARIEAVGTFLPDQVILSTAIEERVSTEMPAGWIEDITGVKARRLAPSNVTGVDMAVLAVEDLLSRSTRDLRDIDCLIYGAALPEIVEPATANILQTRLGLRAPVFDVNNACNGVFTGILIAEALIRTGVYQCVLIAAGEKLSSVIPWHAIARDEPTRHIGALTLGDGAGAVLLTRHECLESTSRRGLLASKMISEGRLWSQCTVRGRGSLEPENDTRDWLMCDARPLFEASLRHGPRLIREVLDRAGWTYGDVDLIASHQVSSGILTALTRQFGRNPDFAVNTLRDFGNLAAANLPVAIDRARRDGRLREGAKLFLGSGAAGFSLGFAAVEW